MLVTQLNAVFPLLASIVSFVFAALVFDQWRQRHRSFQLVWGLGLTWYGISSGSQFLGAGLGWNPALYRIWYLFGAIFVAAYLGMGTIYLLGRTGFGYFAGVSVVLGGLFAYLSQLALIKEGHPTSWSNVAIVIGIAAAGGLAIIVATALRRPLAPNIAMSVLAAASVLVAVLIIFAPLAPPGFAVDPHTGAPVGTAVPGYLRILTGPFNIAGALCLVFGALFSVFVYMPKRRILRGGPRAPVLRQLYGALSVAVNLVASLPRAAAALAAGRLNSRVPATVLIALGGFIPSVTSTLLRFGVTWGFALGEFLGVVLIFAGFLVSEEVFRHWPFGLRGPSTLQEA
jgi:hypothetical protein